MQSLKAILCASWLNVLLIFIPVSWALHFALPHSFANRDTIIFVFSFLAIIPLAKSRLIVKLLGFATEELSLRVGQTLAGLLNATLGNAVELIVAIIALVQCELRVVQASLVGSILSNLLLVLGMCFFAGGMKYSEQGFGISAVQLNSSLLTISVIAVLLPAAFHFAADPALSDDQEKHDILAVSHGVAVILLIIYGAYLSFQLYSHTALYQDKGKHTIVSTGYDSPKFRMQGLKNFRHRHDDVHSTDIESTAQRLGGPASVESSTTLHNGGPHIQQFGLASPNGNNLNVAAVEKAQENVEEEEEKPSLSIVVTVGLLITVTILVAVTAEWLVDSIDGMTSNGKISKEFVGMILLPIVGNAAGWILGKPMTLLFDPYESVTMFLAVLTVNYVVQDGKSNWLEGFLLMGLYFILAVTFWFYPGSDPFGLLDKC
ncbi:Vacuolar calcium ion transporter [Psilocybe cubensis]|uniref:Vacuolar calcium ion transporter n=1 Tax=Psilocybe cubensis TaxID=181762 RepID=A0ACB8H0S2_PSICU|nr:Vacuolar calcium ion transporter [Psilocybe cubensis]KAH9481441.1 Vacuolar calcium ion transporter [Psilocybe cubensis]